MWKNELFYLKKNFERYSYWNVVLPSVPKSIFEDNIHFPQAGSLPLDISYVSASLILSISNYFSRYQDENTQAFFMVVSSNRWLSVRLDLLSGVFVTIVAVAAILVTENPG